MAATSSAPKARSSVRSSAWHIVREVPERIAGHGCPDALRLRTCCEPSCNAVFAICRSCDHGQRYCSAACRKRRRRQQTRAAGRSYQATEAGKLAHRCRQRAYRRRIGPAHVTHQGVSPPELLRTGSDCPIGRRFERRCGLPRRHTGCRRRQAQA